MSKKHPPHLPPHVCNIKSHRSWKRVKILLAAAGVGLLAGVAGASIMLGWIWPGYGGGDTWIVSQSRLLAPKSQLDEKVNQEIRDRIFGVYGNSSVLNKDTYSLRQQDKLGDAIVISSDGWMAMYLPAPFGNYKNWKIVSYDGAVYTVEKILPDHYSGMLYFKLVSRSVVGQSGAQFKVVTFDDQINFGEEIFVLKNTDWHRNSVGYPANAKNPVAHLDTAPSYFFGLENQSDHGAVIINNQGRISGFVNQNGDLLPNIYITRILPTLLSSNKIVYLSLGVEGLFNHEQPIVVDGERKSGFLITKVRVIPSGASDPTLKKGDIILEINGREIETDNVLWYNKDATARVKVWRMREVLEIESKVVEVN